MKTLQLATLPEGIRKTWAFPKRNGPSSSTLNFQELFGQYRDVALKMNPTLHKKSTNILYVGNRSYIAFRKSCQSFTCEFSYNSQTCTKVFFFWGGGAVQFTPILAEFPTWSLKQKNCPSWTSWTCWVFKLDYFPSTILERRTFSMAFSKLEKIHHSDTSTEKEGEWFAKKKQMTLAFTGQKIGIGIPPPLSLTTMFFFFPIFGGHETWGELEVMDVRGNSFPPSSGCNCSWLPR